MNTHKEPKQCKHGINYMYADNGDAWIFCKRCKPHSQPPQEEQPKELTNKPTQSLLLDKLDKLFEKHTIALTKTTEENFKGESTEVVSFDIVVLDAYETKQELLSLFSQEQKRLISMVDEWVIGEDQSYDGVTPQYEQEDRNKLREEQREALNKLEREL